MSCPFTSTGMKSCTVWRHIAASSSLEKRVPERRQRSHSFLQKPAGRSVDLLYLSLRTRNGKIIGVTQPSAIAAVSVARRVAQESRTQLGRGVGYYVRFENCSSVSDTDILFLTDQMLFRETLVDPLLTKYSVIMIDEAHGKCTL